MGVEQFAVLLQEVQGGSHISVATLLQVVLEEQTLHFAASGLLPALYLVEGKLQGTAGCRPGLKQSELDSGGGDPGRSCGCDCHIVATGFCYGGGIANTLAVRLGADLAAAAPFYGAVPANDDIPKIKGAILVHHGALDTRLAATWPAYDTALKAINVPHEG